MFGTKFNLKTLNESATSEEILASFSDVFEGLGCLSTEYTIQPETDAKPVVHPPRKIPFAMKNKVKNKLSQLERMRVIEKVSEPTEWVNSLVVVEKPNKTVRLCLDPRELKKSILREYYPSVRNRLSPLHVLKKVQVGKDQEKAQSKKDSQSKNRGGKKTN